MTATHLLDRVHALASLDALEAEPAVVAATLAEELPAAASLAAFEAHDAAIASVLARLDALVGRAMRLRLDHALAAESSIAAPTRSVFAATVASYQHQLPLLAQRAHDVAARGGAARPDEVARWVVEAARSVLALRHVIREGVLALARERARLAVPLANQHARDRTRGDPERRKWSALRRDLEAIVADPDHLTAAPLATRLAALPEQLDEPAPAPEPTLAELIELD